MFVKTKAVRSSATEADARVSGRDFDEWLRKTVTAAFEDGFRLGQQEERAAALVAPDDHDQDSAWSAYAQRNLSQHDPDAHRDFQAGWDACRQAVQR